MEEPKQIDITKLTVVELKALAFDIMIQRDQMNLNLQTIITEIQKKSTT